MILSSILFVNVNSISSPLTPQLALAQLSGQASTDIDNYTTTLTMPSDQSNIKESFEDSINNSIDNASEAIGNSSLLPGYSFPLAEDQQDSTLPSSSSVMDFGLFMDSFANSIFNGTSFLGVVGTSIVNGIKVSGIGLDSSGSRLSVTLSGTPTEVSGGNNITSANMTNSTAMAANSSNSVSVIAMRIPINVADILSLAAVSSSSEDILGSSMMTGDTGYN